MTEEIFTESEHGLIERSNDWTTSSMEYHMCVDLITNSVLINMIYIDDMSSIFNIIFHQYLI